jgi:hypothetical protein
LQLIHNAARCMLLFFVNNFTNHLYQIGNMWWKPNSVFHFTPFNHRNSPDNEFASSLSANRSCNSKWWKPSRAQQAFISDENQLTIYKILTESIQNNGKSYKEIMNDITTFIFDVDGVLTDGSVL